METKKMPRILIAGLGCESSIYTNARTHAADFHPLRGDQITSHYRFLHKDQPLGQQADWKGVLVGHAMPGGVVTRAAFDSLADEMVALLEAEETPSAGLWFDIHGAMCVEGLDDAEAVLLRRIRAVVGRRVVVSASLDLHGNVSAELASMCDLVTCHRKAPHEDDLETKERACRNLVDVLSHHHHHHHHHRRCRRRRRLLKAWIPIPVLLPGEKTSTRTEPARGIYAAVADLVARHGESVVDAAVWVGYPWADEARNGAVAMVVGWDEDVVGSGAERLARLFWDARSDFDFVAEAASLEECIDAAVASPPEKRPFFISDSGDNPTAGGSGDVTWSLGRILNRPEFSVVEPSSSPCMSVIYASLPGPDAVEKMTKAGLGATVTVVAGAQVDDAYGPPLTMTGKVHAVKRGEEAVLQIGSVFVILTRSRKPYHKESDFTDLDLHPRRTDIVIVKIGYLEPELYDMARGWMLALTPGGVDQDLERLPHARIRRPMWPFDKVFDKEPDLRTRWIPSSDPC
ncbi:hypothetical protein L249_7005 [Ophiocordyceps polyrhachis-furcata BCC 54312]|uniref:Microcystin LR degradation protein MlrC N-terminal domain-containing protein n=1 Tax=Ophiocordyceps polyrhachis-furcata BCC 54312 TaxID=1330021 RepID=A0A367LLI6_9HYPO|nr:hypothetical protein L249_7005 [Ophiocordyceps polyrhachis-furcata BCC 54312]